MQPAFDHLGQFGVEGFVILHRVARHAFIADEARKRLRASDGAEQAEQFQCLGLVVGISPDRGINRRRGAEIGRGEGDRAAALRAQVIT